MEPRNSFVFYRSFYDATVLLRPRERAALILAICEYALDGKEPKLTGAAAAVFHMAKPNLDSNQRRYENGKKGGRPKTSTKPKPNQTGTKSKPNEDVDVNVDEDVNADVDVDGAGAAPGSAPSGGGRERAPEIPTFEEVRTEAVLRGCPDLARNFYDYYDAAGWRDAEGRPVYHWQQKLVAWQQREARQPARRARRDWTEVAREMDLEEGLI